MEDIKNFNDILKLDLKGELNKALFLKLFTDMVDENGKETKSIFKFSDKVKLTLKLPTKTEIIDTTIGRYIFNKFVLPEILFNVFYINQPLNKKYFKGIADILTSAKNNNLIDSEEIANTIDRLTWLAGIISSIQGGGLQANSLFLSDEAEEKIDKIRSTLSEDISDEKLKEADEEVVKILKKEFKETDLGEIVESGAKGSYENNMKSTFGYRGKLQGKFIKGNLSDISPKEYVSVNGLDGSYARSKLTAVGGYASKLVQGGLSHTFVNKNKMDCGTTMFLKTNAKNAKDFLFRYVRKSNTSDQFILLTEKNISQFAGKLIDVRSPMYCKSKDGFCVKCFGESFKINGIDKNLSSLVTLITADLMNKSIEFVPSNRNICRINPLNHGNSYQQIS